MHQTRKDQSGFSLIELLVVVIIIGVLAAIAIPRFLSHRDQANNATAVSDLRNLVAVETSLEATTGMSETAADIAAEGWSSSNDRIVACADLSDDEADITLTVWHLDGSVIYSWRRSAATVVATEAAVPADCGDHGGAEAKPISLDSRGGLVQR